MSEYPRWYRIPQVKFKIRNYTFKRETAFIPAKHSMKGGRTTRMIKIHNVQHLDIWLKRLDVLTNEKDYNLYYSLAHYKEGIPHGSLNLAEREFGNWNKEHWKEMDGYDFLLDIDAGNPKELEFAYDSALSVARFFDQLNAPYHLRFSGLGFHFVIPYHCFKHLEKSFNSEDDDNIYDIYKDISVKLQDKYSEMIDTGIYDSRRVVKIPYSLALNSGGNHLVCYPFKNDQQFDNFNLLQMIPRYVILKNFSNFNQPHEHLFNINGNVFKLLKEFAL